MKLLWMVGLWTGGRRTRNHVTLAMLPYEKHLANIQGGYKLNHMPIRSPALEKHMGR
jgi:hypothetical protein